MNDENSLIIGCAPFGLDDHVISSNGNTYKSHDFFPASVLLPGRANGPILCGDQARAARTHTGFPWPPEAWIQRGEYVRRAPVSLVWRALVEAGDNQAKWDIGNGVSFPLAKILASHIFDLLPPLLRTDANLRLTVPIPNDLDEYGQENLISELSRLLPEKEIHLLWRPVAAAITWLDVIGVDLAPSVKAHPDDFILVLYLGSDAIECAPFQLRYRQHHGKDYIVPRRDRPTSITPIAGYDWIGRVIEQLPQLRGGADGALWQAFTLFPEIWKILAGKDLQFTELPRVWGVEGSYELWHPDQQEIEGLLNRSLCSPSKQIQALLKQSCTLQGSLPSDVSWPQRLATLVTETVSAQTEGRLAGMIICGALAPNSPPGWLTDIFPFLESRGLTLNETRDKRIPGRLWISPGNEAIAQGAALFNLRLINNEPTYLDTLPQYFLLTKRDGKYTHSPLVHVPECEGGEYYENNIAQKFQIEEGKPRIDIIISRESGHEKLLGSNAKADALDREVGRTVEGLSEAGASLIRHLVQRAPGMDEAAKKAKALTWVGCNNSNLGERISGEAKRYASAYANLWHGGTGGSENMQRTSEQSDSTGVNNSIITPFRKLSFPFPSLSPEDMPVDIRVRIRPASGMATMEVLPHDPTFLHGRQVFVDYRTMRSCQLEELREDIRGWPPLEELTPHPEKHIWNHAKQKLDQFERYPLRDGSLIELLNGLYDILKTPKQYTFPAGGEVIRLPVLNQIGLAGSREGEEVISRFCKIMQEHTADINRWNAGQGQGQYGWLITRATWLYGATPINITTRISREIIGTNVPVRIIEAGSRSLTNTQSITDLFNCIAKKVQQDSKFVIQNIRSCNNILTLRRNGQDALNGKTSKIFLKAILKEISSFAVSKNYKRKFFVSIKLLLYLLRYRKSDPDFLKVDSRENERIKNDLAEYLVGMEERMPAQRFAQAKEIISGTIDYLNYSGKTDFLNILTEYSGADDNDEG